MLFDLATFSIIGFIIELFGVKFLGQQIVSAPTLVISFLIVFISVIRWNLWGLLTIPVMVLANYLGGKMISLPLYQAVYDWRLELSSAVGLLTIGLNVILFKKFKTKRCVDDIWKLLLFIVVDFLLYTVVQLLVYRSMTGGNLFSAGNVDYTFVKDGITEHKNLALKVENEYIYNLFGLGVCVIGSLLLRSQGVTVNAVEKLIDDKKQIELDKIDQNFRIKEEENKVDSSVEDENLKN